MTYYAPSAKDVISIDFDATLFPWGPLDSDLPPLPGAVEAMRKLRKDGWYIIIFTSRLSPTWHLDEGVDANEQHKHVLDRLIKHGIPFDRITAEKVPSRYYVDDRAIEFKGDWKEVMRRIDG